MLLQEQKAPIPNALIYLFFAIVAMVDDQQPSHSNQQL